jgi:hypothetical protein
MHAYVPLKCTHFLTWLAATSFRAWALSSSDELVSLCICFLSWRLRALVLSTLRGWHFSHRYSSGMLLLSMPMQSTCCQTLKRDSKIENICIFIRRNLDVPALVTTDHVAIVVLKVTNASGDTVLISLAFRSCFCLFTLQPTIIFVVAGADQGTSRVVVLSHQYARQRIGP